MTGLDDGFAEVAGQGRRRRSRHDPGRVLSDLAVMLADGGAAITDLGVLREQPDPVGRPYAQTSPDREFHHHNCAGHTGGGDPVIKGWSWQWLSQLNFDADSWTAPQDARRVTRTNAAAVTVHQIIAHAARLRATAMDGSPTASRGAQRWRPPTWSSRTRRGTHPA